MKCLAAALFSLAVTACGLALSAYSQTAVAQQTKVSIYVSATSSDAVGQQFVYGIREGLSSSAQLSSALTDSDSAFQLKIVTLDPFGKTDGGAPNSTVYSLVLTAHDPNNRQLNIFLDNWVGTCNGYQVQSCATSMVASVGNDVMEFLGALKSTIESGQQ